MNFKDEVFDLVESFKPERNLLTLVGLYPITTTNFRYKVLYFLTSFTTITIGFVIYVSMLIQMIIDITDLSKLSETLFYFITHSTYMWKMVNFVYHKKNLLNIEGALRQPVFFKHPKERLNILKERIDSAKNIATTFRVMCAVAVVLYGFMPYLDKNKKMSLPLSGWQPYNATASMYYYYPTAAFQVISVCYTATNNVSIDSVTWMLFALILAEFDILKENLMAIDYEKGGGEEFISCVRHHKAIVELAYALETTFSKGMFMMFLASVIVICFTGLMMVLVPLISFQFGFLAIYLACMTTQIAVYCWYGHNVMTTSNQIPNSFYMSNWYHADIRLRKNHLIFLERTKRPVTVTAGKIVDLSLPTLSSILRSSYSYFAVLQRIQQQ